MIARMMTDKRQVLRLLALLALAVLLLGVCAECEQSPNGRGGGWSQGGGDSEPSWRH